MCVKINYDILHRITIYKVTQTPYNLLKIKSLFFFDVQYFSMDYYLLLFMSLVYYIIYLQSINSFETSLVTKYE